MFYNKKYCLGDLTYNTTTAKSLRMFFVTCCIAVVADDVFLTVTSPFLYYSVGYFF